VKKLGATHVINHRQDIGNSRLLCVLLVSHLLPGPQLDALGFKPSLGFITYDTPRYVKELSPHMRAFGQLGSIVEGGDPVPVHDMANFTRALSFHWEFMFAKTMHKYDEASQGAIVAELAKLAAAGTLTSMITKNSVLSVQSLREGHGLQESGKSMGKIVFVVPETWA
jgi:NADPH:quinone reductase